MYENTSKGRGVGRESYPQIGYCGVLQLCSIVYSESALDNFFKL